MLTRKKRKWVCIHRFSVSCSQINWVSSESLMLQMEGQMMSHRSVSSSAVSV